jgi:hypothetical protein
LARLSFTPAPVATPDHSSKSTSPATAE